MKMENGSRNRETAGLRLALIVALIVALQALVASRTAADGGGGTVIPPEKVDSTHYIVTTTNTQSTYEADGEVGGLLSLLRILDIAF